VAGHSHADRSARAHGVGRSEAPIGSKRSRERQRDSRHGFVVSRGVTGDRSQPSQPSLSKTSLVYSLPGRLSPQARRLTKISSVKPPRARWATSSRGLEGLGADARLLAATGMMLTDVPELYSQPWETAPPLSGEDWRSRWDQHPNFGLLCCGLVPPVELALSLH